MTALLASTGGVWGVKAERVPSKVKVFLIENDRTSFF